MEKKYKAGTLLRHSSKNIDWCIVILDNNFHKKYYKVFSLYFNNIRDDLFTLDNAVLDAYFVVVFSPFNNS